MLLYHGSNIGVSSPLILTSQRTLDFGTGFYLTEDKLQAIKWAKRKVDRLNQGQATVSSFEVNLDEVNSTLKVLLFEKSDSDWLDFVVANRRGFASNPYDLVIGPIANDSTFTVINDYLSGRFSREIAIQLLLPQRLKTQYSFLTKKSLDYLIFEGSDVYD